MEYTKGEWEIKKLEYTHEDRIKITSQPKDGMFEMVCFVYGENNRESNARLIATAPDMYEALKELKTAIDKGQERLGVGRLERLEAAIAKAEGKG